VLELVTFTATNREDMDTCVAVLTDRSYAKVDRQPEAMQEYCITMVPGAGVVVQWLEKGKAQSFTPRTQAIENRRLRRELVSHLLEFQPHELPTYGEVEEMFEAEGVEKIPRELLYKQLSDLLGRKAKRSVTH
jgi:hypothetical protein